MLGLLLYLGMAQVIMAVGKKPAAVPVKGKKKALSFVIDCQKPVEDKIMKIGEFEKFLVDKIKVDNKVGEYTFICHEGCARSGLRQDCVLKRPLQTSKRQVRRGCLARLDTWYNLPFGQEQEGCEIFSKIWAIVAGVLGDNVRCQRTRRRSP